MNDIQIIASEVATFYHALLENEMDAYTASMLAGNFLNVRLQYGKFPEESPIIPITKEDFHAE